MWKTFSMTLMAVAAVALPAGAQQNQRRAVLSGGGNPSEGRCTIEVMVDGVAELELRGDSGVLRNAGGRTPQWRRFECTGRMPDNPIDFRVREIDRRGSVQVIRDPRESGVAMVRIEGGADGTMLEVAWTSGQGYSNVPRTGATGIGSNSNQRLDTLNQQERLSSNFSVEQAVRACEGAVRQQAGERWGTDVQFRGTSMDTRPDRGDWVVGAIAVRTRDGRDEIYRFSCAMDFAGGRVRSVQIDPAAGDPYAGGSASRIAPRLNPAVQNCQGAVEARIRRSGYDVVAFDSIGEDARPGRSDWVIGNATGNRGNREARFDFACRVNLRSAYVLSLKLTRRY